MKFHHFCPPPLWRDGASQSTKRKLSSYKTRRAAQEIKS